MTFKEWRLWYRDKNWTSKWFIILILLRPIVDNFYWLKDISPLLSPLNLVGAMTPVLIVASILSGKMEQTEKSNLDPIMRFLGTLVFLNSLIIDIANPTIDIIGASIKYVTPFFLYFYLKKFIRSQSDLLGVLQTFLYACIFPFCIMMYENLFNPIAVEYVTEGRGGGTRIRGGYADIMTYAIYIVGLFLSQSYFFLRNVYYKLNKSANLRNMMFTFIICIVGLISIKHVSTWAVFLALTSLLLSYNIRNAKGIVFIIFIGAVFLPLFADTLYKDQINPLIQKEIDVANGDNDVEAGFNGRIGRWEKYYDIWRDMPFYSILLGVSTSGNKASVVMVCGGMHNDYLRFTFLSGIIGVLMYLFFLFGIFLKRKKFRPPEKYLILCAVISLCLHSISTLPSIYASYMYLLMSIFCYSILPKKRIYFIRTVGLKKNQHPDFQEELPQPNLLS